MHPIEIIATKDAAGTYHFEPQSDLWDAERDEFLFHKTDHDMDADDYHLLEFVIDDRTGDGLRFPKVPHDAMWVAEGGEPGERVCPDRNTLCNYDVMEPISVSPRRRRLFVRNDNSKQEHWVFTINFTKRGEPDDDVSRVVSWDPGGNNQNGGGGKRR